MGHTPEETRNAMREAIRMHLEGLREDGRPIPEPSAHAEHIEAPF